MASDLKLTLSCSGERRYHEGVAQGQEVNSEWSRSTCCARIFLRSNVISFLVEDIRLRRLAICSSCHRLSPLLALGFMIGREGQRADSHSLLPSPRCG